MGLEMILAVIAVVISCLALVVSVGSAIGNRVVGNSLKQALAGEDVHGMAEQPRDKFETLS